MIRIVINTVVLFLMAILWNGLLHLVILSDFSFVLISSRRPDFNAVSWLWFPMTLLLMFLFSVGVYNFKKADIVLAHQISVFNRPSSCLLPQEEGIKAPKFDARWVYI